jgi:Protein of unknown function, DUF481
MKLLLICGLLLLNVLCRAQIVNIENARIHTDTTGWSGDAGAGFSLIKNTSTILLANADIHLQYKTDKSLYLFLGEYGLLKSKDNPLVDYGFLHFRYNYKLGRILRLELFTQLQDNKITLIDSRYLLGGGPRFKLAGSKIFHLYIASLLMYEYEKEKTVPAVLHNDLRQSSYISFTLIPSANVQLTSTAFYQPRWGAGKDYRLLHQAVLKIKAGKKTAVKWNWNYLFDSMPVTGIPSTNYTFSTGISYAFQ